MGTITLWPDDFFISLGDVVRPEARLRLGELNACFSTRASFNYELVLMVKRLIHALIEGFAVAQEAKLCAAVDN